MTKKSKFIWLFLIILAAIFFFWHFRKRKFALMKPISVSLVDNGLVSSVSANSKTVAELLDEKNIKFSEKDLVFPDKSSKIFSGGRIIIQRAIPATIAVDGKEIKIDTTGRTVKDALGDGAVTLSPVDKINPELSATLTPNLKIVVTRINFEEKAFDEDIPFQTVEKEDSTVLWRKKEVKQAGEKGIREKTYKITYTNGKETNRVLLGSKITKQPVSEIDVVGTKIIVGKTQTGAATWYANGDGLTCASLDFAHGKYLRVTNRASGKSVIVLVNDSGPYGKGRVIDLNKKAFQKIGDLGTGVINVKVEEILN